MGWFCLDSKFINEEISVKARGGNRGFVAQNGRIGENTQEKA